MRVYTQETRGCELGPGHGRPSVDAGKGLPTREKRKPGRVA